MTPLYKFQKTTGTTFYAFPGAAEDISSSYQNDNHSMSFSKFVLLDLPKQNLTNVTNEPIKFDFDASFEDNQVSGSIPANFTDQMIESLRNYVANHEAVLRETRLSTNEYFYNADNLSTTTEKIFFKWLRKLNIFDLEPATPQDEYFENLLEFERGSASDIEYFQEYLWKERETTELSFVEVSQGTTIGVYTNPLMIEFAATSNLKVGDIVVFSAITNANITFMNGLNLTVVEVIDATLVDGQQVKFDYVYAGGVEVVTDGKLQLLYDKVVQYIGEINSVNNVVESNKSYTEVVSHIGDHQGATPDVLFRTVSDENYKPNLAFPILPSQYQPEILGAENFNSPIRNTPADYPGDYWGQFDTTNSTYTTSTGDSLRRSGDYYGVSGDVNNIVVDTSNMDGIVLDFNTDHYSKMNITNREVTNFDEFNALDVNNVPPVDFEFNAILWYYDATDIDGNTSTNLYGIEFLNHADNNENTALTSIKIPTIKKLVNDGTKDGSSYSFSLNLNFNITNDNIQPSFDPNNINTLFSFDLYNEAMRRLASSNDSFSTVISEHSEIKVKIDDLTQLVYTNTDIETINNRISNLDTLLQLYSSNQLVSTDTIEVVTNYSTSPPLIELISRDATYYTIESLKVTDLYITSGVVPYTVNVPTSKNFLIQLTNDDTDLTALTDNLVIVIDRDLDYRQTLDINIDATDLSTVDKKLDIYVKYDDGTDTLPIETLLISEINLPVYHNLISAATNSARKYKNIDTQLDVTGANNIVFIDNVTIEIELYSTLGFLAGDTVVLNNFSISGIDYSGQYLIDTITTNTVKLTINNDTLTTFIDTQVLPFNTVVALLDTPPYLSLNKGINLSITRTSSDDNSTLDSRYLITYK
jgi:hypothetical protein